MGPSDAQFPALPLSSNGITITTTYLTVPDTVSFLHKKDPRWQWLASTTYTTFGSNVGGNPQPGILLEPASTTANPAVAAAYKVVAKQAGKPYRIAEGNSIAGSGQAGITNAFEETLWSADVLFEYVKIGAVGFNFHSNDWNSFNQWDAYAQFHFYVPEIKLLRLILTIQRQMAFRLRPPCPLRPGINSLANTK